MILVRRCDVSLRAPYSGASVGGAEGTRTPDPHTASVVRYQLRHSPEPACRTPRSGINRTEGQCYTAAREHQIGTGTGAGSVSDRPRSDSFPHDTPRRYPPKDGLQNPVTHT